MIFSRREGFWVRGSKAGDRSCDLASPLFVGRFLGFRLNIKQ